MTLEGLLSQKLQSRPCSGPGNSGSWGLNGGHGQGLMPGAGAQKQSPSLPLLPPALVPGDKGLL